MTGPDILIMVTAGVIMALLIGLFGYSIGAGQCRHLHEQCKGCAYCEQVRSGSCLCSIHGRIEETVEYCGDYEPAHDYPEGQ